MAIQIGETPGRPYRIADADMSAAQADLVQRIRSGPRRDLPVNMEIWLHSPQFAEVANRFAEYVGHLAPMTRRVKEITILVVAAFWDSSFEWFWHERLGRGLGLTESQLDAIKGRRAATFDDPQEQAACDLAVAFMHKRDIDDELHRRAVQTLGLNGVADLVGLMGLYSMVAFSLDFHRVPVPQVD
jgi:4-carboxymuconolactone decarboxylase